MPYRAFVSSTFVDLKDHRAHVISALRSAGIAVDPMEEWTADSDEPKNFSQDRLDDCDLCVLLVAFRRGFVREGEALSITQLEYEAAVRKKIDILPFMLDDDAPWRAIFDDRKTDPEINRWRSELRKKHGVQPFNLEPASIVMTGALVRWLSKENAQKPASGIVPEAGNREAPKTQITWDIRKKGSPYPGLLHFSRNYASVFFGRDDEIREILYRMHKPEGRFIIVSGDSGVGKSSVVDAGILPKLESGALPRSEPCLTVRMVPGQGSQPFDALKNFLSAYATRAGLRPGTIVEEMKRSPETFTEQIRKISSGGTDGKQLVLFVDQMEELFTAQDIDESNKFLTFLHRATQDKALWVVATIRSDYLHFCHRHPEMLGVLKGSGHHPLGRVEPYKMTDMIVKPANCAGLSVSEQLAHRIVHDTLAFRNLDSSDSDTANLPLLAFVLDQLFEKRSNHSLTGDAYKSMGGVSGAVAEHVKAVEKELRQFEGAKTSDHLAKIFSALVKFKNEESPPTRKRPQLADFPLELRQSVKVLVDARLLSTEGEGERSTVSISHEKLFEAWPALREYISENKKALIDQTLLESRAKRWSDLEKPWFRGLASVFEIREFRRHGVLSGLCGEYVNASWRALIVRTLGILLPAALFLAVGGWIWMEKVTVQYAASIVGGRLHFIDVLDPENDTVKIPGGTFQRSDGRNESAITIGTFKVSKYEVSFKYYDRFVELTGLRQPGDSDFGRYDHPVINVSWEDATAYARWLSLATGKSYRLLTEAEWEYAARSGGKDEIWAGTSDAGKLAEYAVFGRSKGTDLVGTKEPNGLGLYDMSGNVWEWVEDCWHENYEAAPSDGGAWKGENNGQCGLRVIRGGSWLNDPGGPRSSERLRGPAGFRDNGIGFRLAQDSK